MEGGERVAAAVPLFPALRIKRGGEERSKRRERTV